MTTDPADCGTDRLNNDESVQDDKSITEDDAKSINNDKIDILFKATGNAPIMKKKKWRVEQDRKIGNINGFLRKYLMMEESESLFLYVNQSFAPSPDEIIRNLYDSFGSDGKLVVHYCKNPAWG